MSSTSSVASAALLSDSSAPVSTPSPSASRMMLVSRTSPGDGHTYRCLGTCAYLPSNPVSVTCSVAASLANHSAQPLEGAKPQSISGPSSCGSLVWRARVGWLLRTSLVSLMTASSGCAVTLRTRVTRYGRSIPTLRYQRANVAGIESSGWPTPTTRYTHDSPSMRKWPAYAKYQDRVGRTTPRLWEWMMSFPDGWTASVSSATPSLPTSPKSSGEPS